MTYKQQFNKRFWGKSGAKGEGLASGSTLKSLHQHLQQAKGPEGWRGRGGARAQPAPGLIVNCSVPGLRVPAEGMLGAPRSGAAPKMRGEQRGGGRCGGWRWWWW